MQDKKRFLQKMHEFQYVTILSSAMILNLLAVLLVVSPNIPAYSRAFPIFHPFEGLWLAERPAIRAAGSALSAVKRAR
ncbi:hypothetical protein [Parvibaculum sp.]|uniref:hypothetical protein n=1 Tax=Parvibaculum sp. TaxID=2024848 RepID=UPI0032111D3F